MTSKYIPNPIPQRKNASKDHIQVVKELVSMTLIPLYGTQAADDKSLPLTIERKYGEKFSKKKDKEGNPISLGSDWLETDSAFQQRVYVKARKLSSVHIKRKYTTRHIQHYKS